MTDTERDLRHAWWLSHGCAVTALYGDDGEMQCSECGVDFLRWSGSEISARIKNHRWITAAAEHIMLEAAKMAAARSSRPLGTATDP